MTTKVQTAVDSELVQTRERTCQLLAQRLAKVGPLKTAEPLLDLFKACFAYSEEPRLVVVILDRLHRFATHECTAIELPARLKEYSRAALRLTLNNTKGQESPADGEKQWVVLAHNLTGDAQIPGVDEFIVAERLVSALDAIEFKVWDHLVFTRRGIYSLTELARSPKSSPVTLRPVATLTPDTGQRESMPSVA